MTEADWLAWYEPGPLLHFLRSKRQVHKRVWGRRKLRLVAVACCRTAEQFYADDEEAVARVELAERVADGLVPVRDLRAGSSLGATNDPVGNARRATFGAVSPDETDAVTFAAVHAALAHRYATKGDAEFAEQKALRAQAALVRDIFGNPFRPVAADPRWLTSTVVALARGMYESRDFGAMPILADALQEAGCESEDVLTHCRDPKQLHARGCWVVDMVLGKV
jgi:hypothetical protein